jgi:hypothetical protein
MFLDWYLSSTFSKAFLDKSTQIGLPLVLATSTEQTEANDS